MRDSPAGPWALSPACLTPSCGLEPCPQPVWRGCAGGKTYGDWFRVAGFHPGALALAQKEKQRVANSDASGCQMEPAAARPQLCGPARGPGCPIQTHRSRCLNVGIQFELLRNTAKAEGNVPRAGPDPFSPLLAPLRSSPFSPDSSTSPDSAVHPSRALAGLAPACQGTAPCPPRDLPMNQALGCDPSDP